MSLLCFKNCRDTHTLLDMPTGQLLNKKVFNGKKKDPVKNQPDNQNPEIEEDPPYLPWKDKQSDSMKYEEVARIRKPSKGIPQSTGNNRFERMQPTAYDSDEFSHVNLYSKEVMDVQKNDRKLSGNEDENANSVDKEDNSLLGKLGRSISGLLKRSDTKKAKDPKPDQSPDKTDGYEAGESASETQSNISVTSEHKCWPISYKERRLKKESMGIQSPSHTERFELDLCSREFHIMEYRKSSLDGSNAYINGQQNSIRMNLRGKSPTAYSTDRGDSYDGIRKRHWSTSNITPNGGIGLIDVSVKKNWSEQVREPDTTPRRRGYFSSESNDRKYASTGNVTDNSYSSQDSNMMGYGYSIRDRPRSSGSLGKSNSSRIEYSTSIQRHNKGKRREITKHIDTHDSEHNDSSRILTTSEKIELGIRRTPMHVSGLSSVTLNLDFDYKADSLRLYVILKSMHGLTLQERTSGKTNVRAHLVVMPERIQRAYTRRKSEGWTVRFMEKFRFSNITTLNSIAFKVVMNDGSAQERLIGTKTIAIKELILSKGKQSLSVEINQYKDLDIKGLV